MKNITLIVLPLLLISGCRKNNDCVAPPAPTAVNVDVALVTLQYYDPFIRENRYRIVASRLSDGTPYAGADKTPARIVYNASVNGSSYSYNGPATMNDGESILMSEFVYNFTSCYIYSLREKRIVVEHPVDYQDYHKKMRTPLYNHVTGEIYGLTSNGWISAVNLNTGIMNYLVNDGFTETFALWPEGGMIYFVIYTDNYGPQSGYLLMSADINGDSVKDVAFLGGIVYSLAVAPDGTICYAKYTEDGSGDYDAVYRINNDGTDETMLKKMDVNLDNTFTISFSRDGSLIGWAEPDSSLPNGKQVVYYDFSGGSLSNARKMVFEEEVVNMRIGWLRQDILDGLPMAENQ